MKKEAELHAAEDQRKRELAEVRNLADNLIYTTEKTLREAGDKLSQNTKKEIEEKLAELKKIKDSDKIEEIKEKTQQLSQEIQKIGAEMYKAAQEKKEEKGPEEGEYRE
jgi:molecular chaperone DnaK